MHLITPQEFEEAKYVAKYLAEIQNGTAYSTDVQRWHKQCIREIDKELKRQSKDLKRESTHVQVTVPPEYEIDLTCAIQKTLKEAGWTVVTNNPRKECDDNGDPVMILMFTLK